MDNGGVTKRAETILNTQEVEVQVALKTDVSCYHCGQPCIETRWRDDKSFCCQGCVTVYEILSENDLCEYYDLDNSPGIRLKEFDGNVYDCLDEPEIRQRFITFDSATFARVSFHLPTIHCISCVWLLENLRKLEPSVLRSEVNYAHKDITISFDPSRQKLSAIARLLASLGYAPAITDRKERTGKPRTDRSLILKLTVAGFCFGNIMLFSFPEYLGLDGADANLKSIFSWLNLALAVPLFFYCGSDYLRSALTTFRQRRINIDVPIAAGLIALMARSVWEVSTGVGPGYCDSLAGLLFFLLVGRWFQGKTYESLAFDRDFKSYFPLAVQRLEGQEWKPSLIYDLNEGDRIRIRNMEIVPADSRLLEEEASVDYSFVTGESTPQRVRKKELVFAGGRLLGTTATLLVDKKTSQSHLTGLWNNPIFQKQGKVHRTTIDKVAVVFTWAVVAIALCTAAYWSFLNPSQVWLTLTAVLIVACPCALVLTGPFTYGNMMRVFGRASLYVKNAGVVERMAKVDAVVFDKTGTVTHGSHPDVTFVGILSDEEFGYVGALTNSSTHPLSSIIAGSVPQESKAVIRAFSEYQGKGIEGTIDGRRVRIGSASFTGANDIDGKDSKVFVAIDGEIRGYFSISISLRPGMKPMLRRLGPLCAALLSGDKGSGHHHVAEIFPPGTPLHFNQSPEEKMNFIKAMQGVGKHVMMVGDGLNDAGALKQSDVGIAVADNTGIFTPASDGILKGDMVGSLDIFLDLAHTAKGIQRSGLAISFVYNIIALSFAVSGNLTPLVAAILMPLSSISVVTFATLAVNWAGTRKLGLRTQTLSK